MKCEICGQPVEPGLDTICESCLDEDHQLFETYLFNLRENEDSVQKQPALSD